MLPLKNNGKYFLKDTELLPEQKDEFGHEDIAKNIINIIENENAPFNVAIVGKWGLGKSSLIEMVTCYFENNNNYVVEKVNAWKYEKEALRKVLLKRILLKLGYKDTAYIENLMDKFKSYAGNSNEEKMTFEDYLKEWLPLLGSAISIYIIGLVFAIIGEYIFSMINLVDFKINNLTSYILGGFASNIYIPILLVLIQKYIKSTSGRFNFKLTPPITSTDEYEKKLEDMLDKDNRKVITVIDDLDRLTPDEIVEALDAIKAFVNYKNCIFIVPFDDSILKQALKKKTITLNYNEHLAIESDLFLDKLFQYKIFLPSVVLSSLPDYAVKLAKKEVPDLCNLFGEIQFEHICKEILIHRGVTTPRQVKKIINTFANNVMLGYRREDKKVVKEGTFTSTEGLRMLAKKSVIQADFSELYSNLFHDPGLIDELIKIVDSKEDIKPSESLVQYFEYDYNEKLVGLNKSAESLVNFLKRTSSIACDDIMKFLYMSDDEDSILFGNELSKSIRNSLTSGAEKLVQVKLEENASIDLTKLLYNVLRQNIIVLTLQER